MRRHIVLKALILLPILGCGEAQERASAVKTAERGSISAPVAAVTPAAPASADGSVRYGSSATSASARNSSRPRPPWPTFPLRSRGPGRTRCVA